MSIENVSENVNENVNENVSENVNENVNENRVRIILIEIRTNRTISVVQLAKKLNVAGKTMVHDLEKLKKPTNYKMRLAGLRWFLGDFRIIMDDSSEIRF